MKPKEDKRSKDIVFVPFCSLCQAFQARGIVRFDWKATIKPIIDELSKSDINIIQMPCPESQFNGWKKGLAREPMGYKGYDTKEFRSLCEKLASNVNDMIKGILENDYNILAILGIEMSPSCAINYQYSNKGMVNISGVFIQELKKKLKENDLKIPFVGINRRHVGKSLKNLQEIITNHKEKKLL